jgi:hypothetical protein
MPTDPSLIVVSQLGHSMLLFMSMVSLIHNMVSGTETNQVIVDNHTMLLDSGASILAWVVIAEWGSFGSPQNRTRNWQYAQSMLDILGFNIKSPVLSTLECVVEGL